MIQKIMQALFGSQHERDIKELLPLLHSVNEKEEWAKSLKKEEFLKKTEEFRNRYAQGESLDSMLPEAFAMAREAARRTLRERPYDVQILGGIVLHQGKIMEMKTGEGKTLSSVTAAYLNAISGKGVHIVTVNDYLAGRDAEWMKPIYDYLGVTVGFIAAQMENQTRKEAYACDITYGTNNEFGFDYLRDNMRWDINEKVQPQHNYCIIDEIDSILIDEARTPLIISGPAQDDTAKYRLSNQIAPHLEECKKDPETNDYPEEGLEGDFKIDEKSKRIMLTDDGMTKIESMLKQRKLIKDSIFTEENFEYIHYVTQSLKAQHLFQKDVDYVKKDGKIHIVDEFTGRIMYGRRYSEGLHQAIEAKEGIKVAQRNQTLASITFQNFFRMYEKISGMTGTADTEAKEFSTIYGLNVVVIPTNRPVVRDDQQDLIFLNEKGKFKAITDEIADVHEKGQPTLVGTVSIEKSELLSNSLRKRGVPHEVLNAKNHAREASIIAEAGSKGAVTIATNMAGRGTDIKLGGNPEHRARKTAGTESTEEEFREAYKKEYENWKEDYKAVQDAGGLYVLGTERHESRRIDNQLRGRSGRQGDPGKSRFFISLDDDLMRLFGENLKNMMSMAGMRNDEPIEHGLISRSIERAQNKVEERNFEIRKHLLDYDNVLNEQRKQIYKQRDEILTDTHLDKRVMNTAREIVHNLIQDFAESKGDPEAALTQLLEELKQQFFYEPGFTLPPADKANPETLEKDILNDLKADLADKINKVGQENLNLFIRYEYLRNIDIRWQEHLENLEALREAVNLRAYGQKNPLLEYKLEGFEIFDTLIQNIKTAIVKKVFTVKIQSNQEDKRNMEPAVQGQANHRELGQFGAAALGGGSGSAAQSGSGGQNGPRKEASPDKVQVKNPYKNVGRNDPCPCGSGKKFKHCHGG